MEKVKTSKTIIGIAGALLLLIVSSIIAQLLASILVMMHIPTAICNAMAGILYVTSAYLLLKICAEKILKLRLPDLGIPKVKIETKWIVIACILPLFVMGVYFLLPGDLQKGNMELAEAISTICAGIFFIGFASGIVEEMVFRGFIMNLLDQKIGRKTAILFPSFLFGLLHIIGTGFSIVSSLQVLVAGTLVGIMFSLIAIEKHSVWNSAIVHVLWNIIILGGFLSIGESLDEYSVYTYILKTDSFAVTGGEFGIESSIIAIVGYLVVTLIAYMGARKSGK